jgi:hypothetical protein
VSNRQVDETSAAKRDGKVDEQTNKQLRPGESEAQRLDRNFSDILQELRVVQTGVQILFAFLLSLAFYERFTQLTPTQRNVYFVTLLFAVLAAVVLVAPVGAHRMLFRQAQKDQVVQASNRFAVVGLCLVMLSVAGAIWVIADYLYGRVLSVSVAAGVIVLSSLLWFVLPRAYRDKG